MSEMAFQALAGKVKSGGFRGARTSLARTTHTVASPLPVLLACPTTAGTLAATRSLARAGIPVSVFGAHAICAGRLSRHCAGYRRFASVSDEAGILEGLASSRDGSRPLLLAASDETAWLYARHRAALSPDYLLYSPDLETVERILDKARLTAACDEAGIATVPSWFPRDPAAARELAPSLHYPVIIKPRHHLFRTRREKGLVVETADALADAYAAFVDRESGPASATAPAMPMIQQFVPAAVENVVSIAGFVDRAGTRFITAASRKVLQRSRPAGVGLAFAAIEAPPGLAQAAIRLCRRLGSFGIFEIEFLWHDGAWRLIDFNPRFYQEMRLEIARGAPLPLLAYLDATGDLPGLDAALAKARSELRSDLGFSDMFTTTLMLGIRSIANLRETGAAIAWHWRHRRRLVDATFDRRDPLPFLGHVLSELGAGLGQLPRVLAQARRPSVRTTGAGQR